MINLLVISPSDQMLTHAPNGFLIADQVFAEASLKDPLSAEQRGGYSLERTLGYLARRYPRRIRVRWINPWTPGGLLACIRFRVRTFPAVILNGDRVLSGQQLERESLTVIVEEALSKPSEG